MMIFKSEGLQNFEKSSNTHLQNKRLALNFKFQRYASKFATLQKKENPRSFFHFSFRATFIFHLRMP